MSGLIRLHGKEMHLKFPKFTLRAFAGSPREVKLPVSWKSIRRKQHYREKWLIFCCISQFCCFLNPLPSTKWLLWRGSLGIYHSRSNFHNLTQFVLFENITVDLLYHHQWPQHQQQHELLILCIKRVLCICSYYYTQEKMRMQRKENKRAWTKASRKS